MTRDQFFKIVKAARHYTEGKREWIQACSIIVEGETYVDTPEHKHARRAMAHASRLMDHGYTNLLISLHQQTTLEAFHQFTRNLDQIASEAASREE